MNNKNLSLVSVIIPVYGAEKYISRCVESILNQTYTNFELILVDDGSPDRSGEICDAFALKDKRIKVIHTSNQGVSHARNTGIENAKGEYLFFVDSDDWVEENHIETLLPEDDEDLVYGGKKYFRNAVLFDVRTPGNHVVIREEWIQDYPGFLARGLTLFFVHACYRNALIQENGLRFDERLHCSEDGLFNIYFLKYCRKIRYSDTSTYCYEDGDDTSNSLSHRFRPNYAESLMGTVEAVGELSADGGMEMRWRCWQSVFRHYRKWLTFDDGIHRKESKRFIKEAYRMEFYRACIPYVRRCGSLDQKIETYFMRYWLHPLYKPFYSVIVTLYRLKRLMIGR